MCLLNYTFMVIKEMNNRNFKIRSFKNCLIYFKDYLCDDMIKVLNWKYIPNEFINGWLDGGDEMFPEHNDRYLLQCFFNLQEKYDRGQKDFSKEEYERLKNFIESKLYKTL